MATRLFVSERLSNGKTLRLDGERAHYLSRVLRLAPGDRIGVFNGEDGEWEATISTMRKNAVEMLVANAVERATESPLRLHLVQGVSRGERMDFVIQKATELGVKRITPVLSAHGVVRLDAARGAKKLEHWQRVAASACEQCGRTRPPLVDAPLPLNRWFGEGRSPDALEIVLRADAAQALTAFEAPAVKLCLLIGPEGGFSEREYDDAEAAGFKAASLGPRILRTETAALAAIAVAQARWGDLSAT